MSTETSAEKSRVAPKDIVESTAVEMDKIFKAAVWGGTITVIALVLVGGIYFLANAGRYSPSGTQILFAAVCIAAFGIGFMFWKKPKGTVSFEAGNFAMKVVTLFLALAALNFALYQLNPSAPLFNTSEGYGHLAFYAVLIVIAAMIDANLKGKAKFSAVVMLFVVFAIIGPRTGMLYDPDGSVARKLHIAGLVNYFSGKASGNIARNRQCKGVYETHTLSPSPSPMEDGADCWFNYGVKEGTVRFLTEDDRYIDVEAGREVAIDRRIKFVKWRAVGKQAVVHAVFCDKGKTWNGMVCN